MHVSALDYIQILWHKGSINEFGTSVICARTLVSVKLRYYPPHTEIRHVFMGIIPSDICIPIR
jgi:hypothetical protein